MVNEATCCESVLRCEGVKLELAVIRDMGIKNHIFYPQRTWYDVRGRDFLHVSIS